MVSARQAKWLTPGSLVCVPAYTVRKRPTSRQRVRVSKATTSSRPSSGRAMGAMRMPPPNVVPLHTATAWESRTRSSRPPSGLTTSQRRRTRRHATMPRRVAWA